MQRWRHAVPEDEILRIAADIDSQGWGTLADFLSEDELRPLRNKAREAVRAIGGEYVHFTGTSALADTVLNDLAQSAAFTGLCRRLYELATSDAAPEIEFHTTFRCLQGQTGQRHSNRFHYDSYVLTALLPVAIPTIGPAGDLVIMPSTRPLRRGYGRNLVDKALIDNPLAQRLLRLAAIQKGLGAVPIRLQPGSLYFFWGYRSIHTNEACDPGQLRATALFHYGDPHRNSTIRSLIRNVRGVAG